MVRWWPEVNYFIFDRYIGRRGGRGIDERQRAHSRQDRRQGNNRPDTHGPLPRCPRRVITAWLQPAGRPPESGCAEGVTARPLGEDAAYPHRLSLLSLSFVT